MAKSRLDTTGLYCQYAKGAFCGGYISSNGGDLIAPIVWILHTACLPITLTLGIGTKVAIDRFTRKQLSQDEITKLVEQLAELDDASFEEMVKQITSHDAKTINSYGLIEDLSSIDNNTKYKITNLKSRIENNLRSNLANKQQKEMHEKVDQITTNMRKELGDYAKNVMVTVNNKYDKPFTVEELQLIDDEAENQRTIFLNEKRLAQQNLIIEYLKNNMNAGTKTEQIIYNAVMNPIKINDINAIE